jgi:KaiC/GvpD/RAD55 family RecA-like ATPase
MLADIGAPPSGTEVRHEVEGDGRVLKVWHGNGVRVLWSDGTVSAVLVPSLSWDGQRRLHPVALVHDIGDDTPTASDMLHPVEWLGFFSRERVPPVFVLPYLVPEGRQTAVYSAPKVGKSLLSLDVAAAAASGRSVLGDDPALPVRVVYLDLEMSDDDLRDRLDAMGYTVEDEHALAEHFAYFVLPNLPPLDTDRGGKALRQITRAHRADVVIIDTTSRVISGAENDADTFAALYAHTGQRLKRDGVGLLRLDHAGHKDTGSARGSSAKAADVDTVYRLAKSSAGLFTLKHGGVTRVPFMPDDITIRRHLDPLRHVIEGSGVTDAVADVVGWLDKAGTPNTASVRDCGGLLRLAGLKRSQADITAAVKVRKTRQSVTEHSVTLPDEDAA